MVNVAKCIAEAIGGNGRLEDLIAMANMEDELGGDDRGA